MGRTCPTFGRSVQDNMRGQTAVKGARLTIAAGILTIISAYISIVLGMYALMLLASLPFEDWSVYSYSYVILLLLMALFGFLGFGYGLRGGKLSLKRNEFTVVTRGISLLLVSGLVTAVVISIVSQSLYGILLGLPVIILSVLSIVFVSKSKREFITD